MNSSMTLLLDANVNIRIYSITSLMRQWLMNCVKQPRGALGSERQKNCSADVCHPLRGKVITNLNDSNRKWVNKFQSCLTTLMLLLNIKRPRFAGVCFKRRSVFYLTRIPGWAPSSGFRINKSLPPGPAASTIPSDRPKRILRGARLATTTVSLPINSSGA